MEIYVPLIQCINLRRDTGLLWEVRGPLLLLSSIWRGFKNKQKHHHTTNLGLETLRTQNHNNLGSWWRRKLPTTFKPPTALLKINDLSQHHIMKNRLTFIVDIHRGGGGGGASYNCRKCFSLQYFSLLVINQVTHLSTRVAKQSKLHRGYMSTLHS